MYRNIPYEIWKPIPGYEGLYEISNMGRINSFYVNRIMTQSEHHGYMYIILYKNGERKRYLVHRLVQMAFNPIPNPEEYQVNHINGIKYDNYCENLEWCTAQENMEHAYETGLYPRYGEDRPNSILNNNEVLEAVRLYKTGEYTHKELGDMFNVSPGTIGSILNGKTWSHITGILPSPVTFGISGGAKLNIEQVLNIVKLYNSGDNIQEISDIYNMDTNTIKSIILGRTWSDITGIEYDNTRPHDISGAKFSRDDAIEIVRLSKEGYTAKELSKIYGVQDQTIRNVVSGRSWSSVTGVLKNPIKCSINNKLNAESAINIVKLSNEGYNYREISEMYNVTPGSIGNIVRGNTWAHATNIERCND